MSSGLCAKRSLSLQALPHLALRFGRIWEDLIRAASQGAGAPKSECSQLLFRPTGSAGGRGTFPGLGPTAWRVLALPWHRLAGGISASSSGAGSSPGTCEAAPAPLGIIPFQRGGMLEGHRARVLEQERDGRERQLLPHLLCSTADKMLPWPSRKGPIPAEFGFL